MPKKKEIEKELVARKIMNEKKKIKGTGEGFLSEKKALNKYR